MQYVNHSILRFGDMVKRGCEAGGSETSTISLSHKHTIIMNIAQFSYTASFYSFHVNSLGEFKQITLHDRLLYSHFNKEHILCGPRSKEIIYMYTHV